MSRKTTSPFAGTSKIAEVTATKSQLVAAFGEPTRCHAGEPATHSLKSIYEWELRTAHGPITIYDWKEYDQEFGDDVPITWSIGGRADSYKNQAFHPIAGWVQHKTGCNVTQTL